MTRLIATTATGPSHWASYLVNGDASGLEPDEIAHADAWMARHGSPCSIEGDERFTWHYALHAGHDGAARGGNVCDYVILVEGE